jgi:ubiquinone/menaquinone biosynthesis C-methylase UbiE
MRRKAERFDVMYAPVYDESWGRIGESHAFYVTRVIQSLHPGDVILDAACGSGRFFSMILDAGRRVLGVDWSPGMLERCRAKFPDAATEQRHLQHLGFDRAFDGVICVDALENLPPEDWPAALGALQGAAKPMALVYVTVELAEHDNDLGAAYDAARGKGWPVVPGELAEDDGYHYYPERAAVRTWLDEARLEVVEQSDGEGYSHLLCRAGPQDNSS